VRVLCAAGLILGGIVCIGQSVAAPKEHPFTIEVERDAYPVAAIGFMKRERVDGNTLVFFDWGQHVLWELPGNPVSFDGRLDTVYSIPVMNAHWDLYHGVGLRPELMLDRAEVALLPSESVSTGILKRHGWRVIYQDMIAAVLIPRAGRHAERFVSGKPATGTVADVHGRVPFPRDLPVLGTTNASR
jgi:hypothetical protein